MANPNIVNVTTIQGKTTATVLTSSYATQISNGAASGKIFKVNTIIASNTSTATTYNVSVDFYRNSASVAIANGISVPVGSSLVLVGKDNPLYLEEGDIIRALGSVSNYINFVASYEEIS
jgi:hypothetical protein